MRLQFGPELSWYNARGGELAAPLSCPSPSSEAGLLPHSMQEEGTVLTHVQKGKGPPTREEQKEEGEKMQARLANNLHACFHHA